MAVLLDGPAWAARRTAGDRDGLPGDVLTRMMRWPTVQRVWLPAWIADKEAVLDKLEAALAAAYSAAGAAMEAPWPETPDPERLAPELPASEDVSGSFAGALPSGSPMGALLEAVRRDPSPATIVAESSRPVYQPWKVRRLGSRDVLNNLDMRRSVAAVREAMGSIVEAEGPVHQVRLAKLTCAAFDLNKMNDDRANSVLDLLDTAVHYCDDDGFIWDASVDRQTWNDFRPNGSEVDRKPEQISVVEIRNAMAEIVRLSGGIAVDELHREAIQTFGGKRRTAGVTARLNQGLQYGVDTERLVLRGGLVYQVE